MNADTENNVISRFYFKKNERLSSKEIKVLFQLGRRIKSKNYLGIYSPKNPDGTKLAVTLKRKWGNAVSRNYEKRTIIEIFRKNKDLIPKNYIIIMRISKNHLSFMEKQQEIISLFMKMSK